MGAGGSVVALLRAINVGGRNLVSMTDLRDLFARLGFADVRSLLQSGNVVFRTRGPLGANLEDRLEAEARRQLDLTAGFFVRTAGEWDAVVAQNPFPEAAEKDPGRLAVIFLKREPEGEDVDRLRGAIKGRELVHAHGRHLYAVYPDGMGKSRLTGDLIERLLCSPGTARNWNTVLKVQTLLKS